MRFAWLKQTEYPDRTFTQSGSARVLLVVYNLIWWAPIVLPFVHVISYHDGFVGFFFITMFRAAANAYRVNVLPPEKAMVFPLRQP